jgi:serine/threonine protein kinase
MADDKKATGATSSPSPGPGNGQSAADLEGGSYEVIHRRLLDQAAALTKKAEALNDKRKQVFGGQELAVIANERIRTENNCLPRDMIGIGGRLLVGFEVFLGLKSELKVEDVFSVHNFERTDGSFDLTQQPFEGRNAFLADEAFSKELRDTFRYMKGAKLSRLRRTDTRLLASIQVGEKAKDIKVFRWSIDAQGRVVYMDARGDQDNLPPKSHDFAWTLAGRDSHVGGKHPHVNILDQIFVETIGGDLTIKIENNTKTGKGIYQEPVDDGNQTLDDADISYAQAGGLILLRIKPFRENKYRYLAFAPDVKRVQRFDAIGLSCISLPEDHGIVFPGGYALRTGESKVFDGDVSDMELERVFPSPNGEDVLYVYFRWADGKYVLMSYNAIRKEMAPPIHCNGMSLFSDGLLAVFRSSEEPTRVHPLQIWQTPFVSAEHAASAPTDGSYLSKVGNKDLVRGVSDALSIGRLARTENPTRRTFVDVLTACSRFVDAYYWGSHAEALDLAATLKEIRTTADGIIHEFEKAEAIKRRAKEALDTAETEQKQLLATIDLANHETVDAYLGTLTSLRMQRGKLIGLRELRGVDLAQIDALEKVVITRFDEVTAGAVTFLATGTAFAPLVQRLAGLSTDIEAVRKVTELAPHQTDLDTVQTGLTLLGEVIGTLKIDDTTARTQILEEIGTAFAELNRTRATLASKRNDLSIAEGRAEFAAQLTLLGQSVTSAVSLADTPEKCDEQLSRLLLTVEELEGRFGEIDDFLVEITERRQAITDAFGGKREQLQEERQRRAGSVAQAADRILQGIDRKARTLKSTDELHAYFASDAMVLKVSELADQLTSLNDTVRADELRSRLLATRQDALRSQRDKQDLWDGDLAVVKLGAHKFSVHTQPLELTLVPRGGGLAVHLTGTDFYENVDAPILAGARDLWDRSLLSESPSTYRAEYLAASLVLEAEAGKGPLDLTSLTRLANDPDALRTFVREQAANRLDEGYERGLHDADAALILERLLPVFASAGLLRYPADDRALACFFWADYDPKQRDLAVRRAESAMRLATSLGDRSAADDLADELAEDITAALEAKRVVDLFPSPKTAARYLVAELATGRPRFTTSQAAENLRAALFRYLEEHAGGRRAFDEDLRALERHPRERLFLARSWVSAFTKHHGSPEVQRFQLETAVLLVTERGVDRQISSAPLEIEVTGLLGQHPTVRERTRHTSLDELLPRIERERGPEAERFRAYRTARTTFLHEERERLRLSEYSAKVLTSFVRNRLIDEVYLPLVGKNLAKQIGTVGGDKRTDRMGLLLLISPPGYGKTTLMEYISGLLGLVFMKVNGPALGHEVTSLDPSEAPNATARQEVEKINLALEMGNNVMLYLDDIQHTSSELLQKFISLCDGQRRIEGVWNGKTRTYDLRGKKFAVVMAGNPYTESGARFQIPDMLANRADTYNLGDILDGKEDLFALSYLENALTSNRVLAPLAGRDRGDVHKLVRMAAGENIPTTDLAHGYSGAEVQEIVEVFRRLQAVQRVLLQVNKQYIASASQADAYRTEPPFKLQGSYRNMSKMAEKVVAVMNDAEVERLIDDHYAGESQTLTTAAEANLLKLAEMRGRISDEQRTRLDEIRDSFARVQRTGGSDADPTTRVTGALSGLDLQLKGIREAMVAAAKLQGNGAATEAWLLPRLDKLANALALSSVNPPPVATGSDDGKIALRTLVEQQIELIEKTLVPLVQALAERKPDDAKAQLFGRFEQLHATLARLETSLAKGVTSGSQLPPALIEATLQVGGATSFYTGVDGDVATSGGLFVSTYGKLPSIGSRVVVRMVFPDGNVVEAAGRVAFRQDYFAGDGNPVEAGFGVRFDELTPEALGPISRFLKVQPPMFREPLPFVVPSWPPPASSSGGGSSMTQNIDGKSGSGGGGATNGRGGRIGTETVRVAPVGADGSKDPGRSGGGQGAPISSPASSGTMVQNARAGNRPAAVTLGFGAPLPKVPPPPGLEAEPSAPQVQIREMSLAPAPVSVAAPTERAPAGTATPLGAPSPAPSPWTVTPPARPPIPTPSLGLGTASFDSAQTLVREDRAGHAHKEISLADTQLGGSPAQQRTLAAPDLSLAQTQVGAPQTAESTALSASSPSPDSLRQGASLSRHSTVLPRVELVGTEPRLVPRARDRYERVKPLGEGGVGEVLLAQDHDIDRKVAIKALKPDMQAPGHVIRFVDEVRTVGSLEHPNIVPIHDVGVDANGQFFFVMKYVAGETLESIIEKLATGDPATHRRYPIEVRTQIVLSILRALQYAHAQGIVHRDLKPANIMLGEFGEVMVMDWGLAKKIKQPELPFPETNDGAVGHESEQGRARLFRTRHGTLLGTPAYMSPEQARAQEVDQRCDLYSIGVLFFELLTLEHYLRDRQTLADMLAGVLHVEVPAFQPRSDPYAGGIPHALVYFCAKAMKKDPAERFQTADEMASALQDIIAGDIKVTCHVTFLRKMANRTVHFLDGAPHVFYAGLLGTIGFAGYGVFSLFSRLVH